MKKVSLLTCGIFSVFGLVLFNYFLIYPWFGGNGPANLGSIEVSYVSMARFIRDFFPHLSFAPYWYFGFPFHVFYTPILPFSEFLINRFTDISLWQSYRVLTGLGLVLAPVSLLLFTWYLTRRLTSGILAGLLYSLAPSLFYFILPSGEVAADTVSLTDGFYDPRRLVILARWGEGPHTFSLVFLPLAALFFLRYFDKPSKINLVLAGFFIGLTALTNAVGLYALLFLIASIFFALWVKNGSQFWQIFKKTGMVLILTYGLVGFWYNLSFLSSFFGEGGGVLKNYLNLLPWGAVFFVLAMVGLFFFYQKVIKERAIIISLTWFLIVFLIVYIYYVSAPSELSNQRIELAPQALRLMTEIDMALAVLVASVLALIFSLLETKLKMAGKVVGGILGVLGVVGILGYGLVYLPYGQKVMSGVVDLEKTGEYEIASWLSKNVDQKKGERVFVFGNYGFYLNYFTNIWQLRGGLYQAKTHPWPGHIYYQMAKGENEDLARAWLRIADIKYIVINTQASRELYKEIENQERFENLDLVYEKNGDLVYQVPSNSFSPAKIVNLSEIEKLKSPKKADDKKPILAYESMLDRSRPADFAVINNDHYQISGNLNEGEGILVQMTADSGFRAKSQKGNVQIKKDVLGFMVLIPERSGNFEINLVHGRTWKIWLGYLITLISGVSIIAILIKDQQELKSS